MMIKHKQTVLIDAKLTSVHMSLVKQRYNHDSRACADVHVFIMFIYSLLV